MLQQERPLATKTIRLPLISAIATLALTTAASVLTWPDAHAGACPSAPEQGNLCTARDFIVSSAIVDGPSECTAGETIAVTVRVGLTSTANQRYDIGIFSGDHGEPVFGGASCSLDALVPLEPPFDGDSGFGGYRDLDGDACGDVSETDGEIFRDVALDKVLCQDNDGDGQVDISGLVTWSSNASQDVCSDPTDPVQFFPTSSSKCILNPDFNLPIIVEPPPSLRVFKLAFPGNLPAPGGNVLFVLDLDNNSTGTDPITVSSLVDDVHGDVTRVQGTVSQTNCSVPQLLVPGASYTCEFVAEVTGPPDYVEVDTITVTGTDDEGEIVTATGQARVIIGDEPASILVGKSVTPTVVREPGEVVTYSVLVANESDTESVEITTLDDDLYGSLSGVGNCPLLPFSLAPGEIMRCKFLELVSGNAGDPPVVDVITADGPGIDFKTDDAAVSIADVAASIEVSKTAIPRSLPEPGGTFTYELQVQNTSPVDTVTIDAIADTPYGDLDGQGSCAVGQTLAPAEIYSCSFTREFLGPPGAFQSNVISVTGTDADGGREFDYDFATVFIEDVPSSLAVTKTPNRAEQIAGGPVVYTVSVENTSAADTITLNGMQDTPYGDITTVGGAITATTCALTPAIVLPPAGNYTCQFTATVTGALGEGVTDTVSVSGIDNATNIVIGADSATVTIVDNSQPPPPLAVIVTKVALPSAVPVDAVPADVTYLFRVANPNGFDIQITDLADDIYDIRGNAPAKLPVTTLRDCPLPFLLAAGQSRVCIFSGAVDGSEGDVVTDVITVFACAPPACAETVTDSDDASVTITPGASSLALLKTADPVTVQSPGGPVTFTVEAINTSPSAQITITSLVDDIYGDITAVAGDITSTNCANGQVLAPSGGRYSCSFSANVTGVAGTEVVDTVTASGEATGGYPVQGADSATVEILGLLPRVEMTKTADPVAVRAPGGTVTFTAEVLNTSATETLTMTSLVDDVYGDLNGQGNCATPQVIAAAATYRCEFPGVVSGDNASLHRDTIAMAGSDESGDPVADSDWAVVLVLPFGIGGEPIPVPVNPLWLAIAASAGGIGLGLLALWRRQRRKQSS
ncbi:hypothetical protein E2F43_15230 [Seongchinamella unica]|uniref:DUF11 domain-containing protein n=1 Tax=Seongchinamella unica TaxID=2547392 RepID=A0A4R5LR48_9GAMM|nr:hypothetical protein [Seongchinamella unica]TDG12906.1 hypothetical protein E2F43_15230 [Seongchinamella unica]